MNWNLKKHNWRVFQGIICLMFCSCLNFYAQTQIEISNLQYQNFTKDNERLQGEIVVKERKVVLVDSQLGQSTYELHNDELRRELLNNREMLESIVSLPGLIEIGVYNENLPIRVVVDGTFLTEVLYRYFKF